VERLDSERLLILALTPADAERCRAILADAGLAYEVCTDSHRLIQGLREGAGAILLAGPAPARCEAAALIEELQSQPPWSDIPVLAVTDIDAGSAARHWPAEALGNVVLLDRSVSAATLASAARTAIRARCRQYDARDQIEALRRSEERFDLGAQATQDSISDPNLDRALHAAIVESSDDAIVSKTLDGIVLSWNKGAERLFGYSAEEMIGQSIRRIIPPDRQAEEDSILERFRRGERIDHYETIRRSKHGQLIDISLTVSPVRDSSGRVVAASKVARDITARKRFEEMSRRQSERLRLLWEAASVLLTSEEPDAMLRALFAKIAPHLGLDTYFNFMVTESGDGLRLESCIGVSAEEARKIARVDFGQAVCGTVALRGQPIVMTHIQSSDEPMVQLVKSFGIRAYACNPLLVKDRLLGTLSLASRQRDDFDADEIDFMRTICHYVTVAYERVRLIRELRDTDRRKDEFLATLAHELRNPLAPIRNALHIMQLKASDAAVLEQARAIMERQLKQMVRLIDDLLDVSRITRGKLELRKERVDLESVIKNAVDTSRPLIEASTHQLTISLTPQRVVLDADPVRLAQVFSNLLNNAAKYMEPGGRISVTADQRKDEVVVTVRDNGMGIPAEALPSIFEMFTQVDRSLERSQGGLGVGLTLVKRLVEMHGGSVSARSDGLGKGAEFAVRLPAALAPPAQLVAGAR
jgi:PAS domain S-box-containing protein